MEWEIVRGLLDAQLLIVLAVCWVLGFMLKQTPRVPNWSIVYIVSLVAVVFAVLLLGNNPLSYLQGFLCGAVSVYGYEIAKQTVKGVKSDADA